MKQTTIIKTDINHCCNEFKLKNCLGEFITLINDKFETITCLNCDQCDIK